MNGLFLYVTVNVSILFLSMGVTICILRCCGIKKLSWGLSTGFILYISILQNFIEKCGGFSSNSAAPEGCLVG